MQPERARYLVADEIRVLMARHRITQADLGVVLGVTQTAVSKRIRGEVAFDVDELAKIAQHFGIEVTDLLEAAARGAA
jgi:transcriptional regulator with XRE-family HTH domain